MRKREREREYVDGSRRMTPQGMMDGYVEFAAFAELLYFCLHSRPLYIYMLEGEEEEDGECYARNAKMSDVLCPCCARASQVTFTLCEV